MFPISLDDDFLNTAVRREFLSETYGGSLQDTFPSISKANLDRHGYDNFMFLTLDYNPYAPQRPGYPGLFFTARMLLREQAQRAFVRLQSGVWLYIGQYIFIEAPTLTQDEWKTQTRKVSSYLNASIT